MVTEASQGPTPQTKGHPLWSQCMVPPPHTPSNPLPLHHAGGKLYRHMPVEAMAEPLADGAQVGGKRHREAVAWQFFQINRLNEHGCLIHLHGNREALLNALLLSLASP